MYKFSYAEILDDAAGESRARERLALDHAVELLIMAEKHGQSSQEAIEAIDFVRRLWSFLISDLIDSNNALDEKLRADLISIGLWAVRESEAILSDPTKSFTALIEINRSIRDGLK